MQPHKNILIALDDSEASRRAVAYVAQFMEGRSDVRLHLFHVPAPMPPKLLEFGGREHPEQERQSAAALQQAQDDWRHDAETKAQPLFAEARALFSQAKVPDQMVESQLCTPAPEQDLDTSILEAARLSACRTIVVGRESFSWLRELVQQHLADRLMQHGEGFTLWVVQ